MHQKRAVIFLFLWALTSVTINISFCSGNSEVRCIETERQALLTFKHHLKDPSNRLASWGADDVGDCCTWVGVVCNNVTGRVRKLYLRSSPRFRSFATNDEYEAYQRSSLGGKIHPSLLSLKHLKYLDLSFNNFGNTQIPTFLGLMGRLRYLNLSNAGFGGLIPYQLGNLSNLHYLDLRGIINYSSLYVKSLQWLSGLPLLKHLDLSEVDLSQASDWLLVINQFLPSLSELHLSHCHLSSFILPIPISNVNFSSLSVLDLSLNSFDNSLIPPWIFRLNNLFSLDLSYTDLRGIIPDGLKKMTLLRKLVLSGNYLNSSIPNWLYGFNHLEFLDLSSNDLQGTISSAIGNLTSAININLFSNPGLEGKLPSSMGNLCNLRGIYFSGIKFNQEISEILKIFSGCVSDRLETLYLEDAQLFGHMTDELIGQFKNLELLSLLKNSISGQIPVALGNLPSLRYLELSNNKFNGTLPQSIGQLEKLEYLSIGANMLEGVVSEVHFSNLRRLTSFKLSQNPLILKLSPDWVSPFQLQSLHLRSWFIGPKFPSWLCSQKHLYDLDISSAGISDTIPSCFRKLASQFSFLNLSHNQINGEISNVLVPSLTYSRIDLSSNRFRGSLPALASNVIVLDLSNNHLSGSISHFLCYQKNEPKEMQFLNLQGNRLSGNIPDCWGKWQRLKVIRLGNNSFTGSIPASMGSLVRLESLHLQNNKLSGVIPLFLKNCTKLQAIDFGENEFVGLIPSWVGQKLSRLMILNLRSNNFNGRIPEELCALTSLQILILASNTLSGRIPSCIHNFSAMATNDNSKYPIAYFPNVSYEDDWYSENAVLVRKGKIVEYSTTLHLVKDLDLSNNNLSGEIPKEVVHLIGLQSLNLSNNFLIGSIPKNIGVMVSLESIDFSVNRLSGEIPPSMSSLTFLSVLKLSYNKLTGKIPSSTQLQSLDASSFIGNELCGPPLSDNCGANGAKPNIGNGGSKEGNGVEVDWFWFYVSIAPGFVVGFWGVWGPLLLKKRWRIAYFKFLDHMGYKVEMLWYKVVDVVSKCCKISNN